MTAIPKTEVIERARETLNPHAHRSVRALLRETARTDNHELEAALWDVVYDGVREPVPERVAWKVQRELEQEYIRVQRFLDGIKPHALVAWRARGPEVTPEDKQA